MKKKYVRPGPNPWPVKIGQETMDGLLAISERRGQSRHSLMVQAMEEFVARELGGEWQQEKSRQEAA